jgi:hypothetical protein
MNIKYIAFRRIRRPMEIVSEHRAGVSAAHPNH